MEIDIDLAKLKLFCDTVRNDSVLGSARQNAVTPSTVSHSIKNLEKLLGVPLSTHKRKKFELTDEGQLVFDKSNNIFLAVRDLIHALDLHKEQACRPIKFASLVSIAQNILPRFLPQFQEDHPDARLNCVFTGEVEHLKDYLSQETAEIVLGIHTSQMAAFESLPLYQGHFQLYRRSGDASNPREKGVIVENSTVSNVRALQRNFLNQYDGTAPVHYELNNWEMIAKIVQSAGGFGFFPDFLTWGGQFPDLEPYAPRTLGVPYELRAYVKDKRQLSRSAEIFLDEMTQFILKESAWRNK